MNTLNSRERVGPNGISATQANMTALHALDNIGQSGNGSTHRTVRYPGISLLTVSVITASYS